MKALRKKVRGYEAGRRENGRPDRVASIAHTLKSTRPAARAIARTSVSAALVATSEAFFGHAILGAVQASKGVTYRDPFALRLLKQARVPLRAPGSGATGGDPGNHPSGMLVSVLDPIRR